MNELNVIDTTKALPGSRGRKLRRQAAIDNVARASNRRKQRGRVLEQEEAQLEKQLRTVRKKLDKLEAEVREDTRMIAQLRSR